MSYINKVILTCSTMLLMSLAVVLFAPPKVNMPVIAGFIVASIFMLWRHRKQV